MLPAMIKHTRFIALLSWVLICACESRGVDPSSAEPAPPAPTEAQQTDVAKAPLPAPNTPAAPPLPEPAALTTKAELGNPAPDVALPDLAGKSIKLSDYKGKTVVLEWFNPDCPFVKHARGEGELKTMASKVMGDDLVWLTINSSAPGKQGHGVERNKTAVTEYKVTNTLLLDESGAVGKSYGAEKTPHLFVISKAGDLIYRGAIDNAPIGKVDPERPRLPDAKEGSLINYVSAALEDAKASKALRLPETAAYGCSVKYGDS
jgi:peroxiredoxin